MFELASDDSSAVRQVGDERVDKRLIVKTIFAAGRIPGVEAGEWAEVIHQPIGLRAVVVRKDREVATKGLAVVIVRAMRAAVPAEARDVHGLGAAGQLPEDLVAAAQRIRGARWR